MSDSFRNSMNAGWALALLSGLPWSLPLASQDMPRRVQLFPQVKHKQTIPLRAIKAIPPHTESVDREENASASVRKAISSPAARSASTAAAAVRSSSMLPITVTAGLNIEGTDADGTRVVPDTNGAVGATQYVQSVNVSYKIFDKVTGNLLLGPVLANTLWTGFGGPCETSDDGDPIVEYDKMANVWVMAQHAYAANGAPFYYCVAVSKTSDATGAWNLYAFLLPSLFPDYPKLGVWPDAYYVSINEQDPSSFKNLGALVCALDRSSMIAGTTASPMQCFNPPSNFESLLPSDLDGSILPPTGSPNYFMNMGVNSLNMWQFHVDWTTPANSTFTGPTTIPVSLFKEACGGSSTCVPQVGTTQLLDGIGDRLMFRLAYRHFADGHESLVASHSVSTPSGIRWYEIQNPSSAEVVQQATFSPDSNYRWMPSIAMDQMGDVALGYSVSSSSMAPAIRYTGRLQSDPLDTMQSENSIIEGSGVQSGSNRWGDYSSMSIDPSDDCTFFYTNEYLQTTGSSNWNTRIASFKFPSCTSSAQPVILIPSTLYFSNYALGTTSPSQTVTLTNNQLVQLNISNISTSGDFAQTNTCGNSVAAQGNCTFTITFTPTVQGIRTGQIIISDDASGSPQQVINMTGTGGGPIVSLAQTSLTLSALVGGSTSKTVKMTNTGAASLQIASVLASGDYSPGGSCTTTSVLTPGATCAIIVTFRPSVTGPIQGAVTINDNAPGSPQLISLAGTGQSTLSVSPSTLTFTTTTVGSTSAPKTVTILNNAASAQNFSYAASGDYQVAPGGGTPCGASPTSLNAVSKCTVTVTFAPTTNGTIKGSLTVTDSASGLAYNPQIVSLSGVGSGGATPALAFQPTTLGFSNVVVGNTPAAKNVSVKNSSGAAVTITGLTSSGDFALSNTGSHLCQNGTLLNPGSTCTLSVLFTPSVQGSLSGSVTITDNATSGPTTEVSDLTGTGVWPITLSPTSLTFSAQSVGTTSSPQTVTVLNYSTSTVTLSSIGASGNFAIVPGGASPCSSTVSAAVGQTPGSCTFTVTFTPSATGLIKGAATVSHNAAGNNSPQVVSLSGTGQ
jgi:Abnormal spindle-like microcephaly-assoc'd, ASPM-SPD-2-Hydin